MVHYNSALFVLHLASRWTVIIQLLPIFLSGLPTLFSFRGYYFTADYIKLDDTPRIAAGTGCNVFTSTGIIVI